MKFLLVFLLLASPLYAQQSYTALGEAKTVCSIWDGVDRALVDASGRLLVISTQSGTYAVTGTFWQATQPVSGTFWQATQPVSGTFWQATQPVSGTVTLSNAFLLDATYTGRMPAGASPGDNETNTNTALSRIGNYQFLYDGTTWDRDTGARSCSQTGTWVVQPGNTANTTAWLVKFDQGTSNNDIDILTLPNVAQATAANLNNRPDTSGATGAAPPARANYTGANTSGATGGFLAGITACTEFFAVDIVTATTTLAITGVSGRHVYICSINLITAAANNVAIIAGTGATCGTSTAGLNGGVTGAEGWNFGANGGIAQGSGIGVIMSTLASGGATGDSVCIITTAGTQLSGTIGYAIY